MSRGSYGTNGFGGGQANKGGGGRSGEPGGNGIVIVSYLQNSPYIISIVGESSIISVDRLHVVSFTDTDTIKSFTIKSPCRMGSFLNHSGVCEQCPLGFYQDEDGKSDCKICPAGEVSNKVGSVSCKQCRPGSYSVSDGQTHCKLCPENSYSSMVGSSYDSCIQCEEGYGAPPGSSLCCPIGMFAYQQMWAFCEPCPVNTYGSSNGGCISCPVGRYSRHVGSSTEDSCVGCGSNEYLRGGDVYECSPCPVGSIPASVNATTCKACPAGQSATLWDSECSDCPAGKYSDRGGPCLSCPAGKYSKAGNATCTTCEPDTFSSEGSSECNSCSS